MLGKALSQDPQLSLRRHALHKGNGSKLALSQDGVEASKQPF